MCGQARRWRRGNRFAVWREGWIPTTRGFPKRSAGSRPQARDDASRTPWTRKGSHARAQEEGPILLPSDTMRQSGPAIRQIRSGESLGGTWAVWRRIGIPWPIATPPRSFTLVLRYSGVLLG
jgi:hypothetical protein